MCGIGGVLRKDGQPIPDAWLDVIDARLEHRGPDGGGRFRDWVDVETPDGTRSTEVAFVHRRLSIIDHETGAQPMVSERGRTDAEGLIAVAFNGCIYNHRELREQLVAEGHRFTTDHSDTEVLIHGYREWGADLADHLEGMYAFALWCRTGASLILARDLFGEKPLYLRYGLAEDPSAVAFASDARALATLDGVKPVSHRLDRVERFLQVGYAFGGRTLFDRADIHQVQPSIVDRHLQLMPAKPRLETSIADFDRLLDRAVARRLEADVPLGCFLSGGVDSSLIAHYARAHKPDLRTFSVRMPDSRYDESRHAEAAARHLETDHATLAVSIDPANDLVRLIDVLGQPFGDSSILPTYWVSRAARAHVKVAISGDGGDELFLGYDRYMAARALMRHRRILRWLPRNLGARAHPRSRRHKLGRLGGMARDLPAIGIAAMESIFTQEQIADLLGRPPKDPVEQLPGWDAMQALRRFDLCNYLPDDLLCKVDTASMAVALEVRAPLLDRDVVAAALAAPTWHLAPNGRRKGLLRTLARTYLPAEIVDRPKMGFAIPIGEWFRDDFGGMRGLLIERVRDADCPFGPFNLNRDAVNRLIDEHLSGRADHGQRLFALLTLAIWARGIQP